MSSEDHAATIDATTDVGVHMTTPASKELSVEQLLKLQRSVAEVADQNGVVVAAWLIRTMCHRLLSMTDQLLRASPETPQPTSKELAEELKGIYDRCYINCEHMGACDAEVLVKVMNLLERTAPETSATELKCLRCVDAAAVSFWQAVHERGWEDAQIEFQALSNALDGPHPETGGVQNPSPTPQDSNNQGVIDDSRGARETPACLTEDEQARIGRSQGDLAVMAKDGRTYHIRRIAGQALEVITLLKGKARSVADSAIDQEFHNIDDVVEIRRLRAELAAARLERPAQETPVQVCGDLAPGRIYAVCQLPVGHDGDHRGGQPYAWSRAAVKAREPLPRTDPQSTCDNPQCAVCDGPAQNGLDGL